MGHHEFGRKSKKLLSGQRKYDGKEMIDTVWYATNPTITTYKRINQLKYAEKIQKFRWIGDSRDSRDLRL